MHIRKVLIAGATGYIGQTLVSQLIAAGHHVAALYRNSKPDGLKGANWICTGDLSTSPLDHALAPGVDTLVALAAPIRPTSTRLSNPISETERIARTLRDFAASAKIRNILVVSSVAARVAEGNAQTTRQYGIEKAAADQIFLGLSSEDHNVIILRPPAVYGPGMRNSLSVLARLISKGFPIPLGCATATRHYISLRNLTTLMETIVGGSDMVWASAAGQTYEPSDGVATSSRLLVQMMAEVIGCKPHLIPLPIGLLRAASWAIGRTEIVSGAVDRLDICNDGRLEHLFDWRPAEQMPESLTFLKEDVMRA